MLFSRETLKRLMVPLLLALLGLGLCLLLVPYETRQVQEQLLGFPDSDVAGHRARPFILGAVCFLPALAALLYSMAGTLARYLTRQFLGILGICFFLLLVIWFLQDLTDNLSDLRRGQNFPKTASYFYLSRLPFILRELLPYALLLSLLFCLGKFSKSREIVAMIQTGRSLPRLVAPLIAAGLFCTALCTALNYHWAPIAEGGSDAILQRAMGAAITEAKDVIYRNPGEQRLWMVGTFPKNYEGGSPLLNVEVTTTDGETRELVSRIAAKSATWNRQDRTWTFHEAYVGEFKDHAYPLFHSKPETVVRYGWPETPWQLIKPGLSAPYLGIPDLNSWLVANKGNEISIRPQPYLTQWHYRWAQPVICLVTVLLAAPLGIHFSRRGSTGGVAAAVGLSISLVFITTVSLTLGEAGILSPVVAAWMPNILFALLGFYLFHRRMAGRPIYQSILRLFPNGD